MCLVNCYTGMRLTRIMWLYCFLFVLVKIDFSHMRNFFTLCIVVVNITVYKVKNVFDNSLILRILAKKMYCAEHASKVIYEKHNVILLLHNILLTYKIQTRDCNIEA